MSEFLHKRNSKYIAPRVKQVIQSDNAQRMYNRYYGGNEIGVYSISYIIGYRLLLRYITVRHGLNRFEYEILCYYGLTDSYVPVRAIMTIFGVRLAVLKKMYISYVEFGLLEAKYSRPNCTTFRITPKGLDLLNDCVEYWRINIQS